MWCPISDPVLVADQQDRNNMNIQGVVIIMILNKLCIYFIIDLEIS